MENHCLIGSNTSHPLQKVNFRWSTDLKSNSYSGPSKVWICSVIIWWESGLYIARLVQTVSHGNSKDVFTSETVSRVNGQVLINCYL